jgi:hypothetical protein
MGREAMRDPNHLREQARKCRTLAKTAIRPELIEQLRLWSVELADEAHCGATPRRERTDHHIGLAQLSYRLLI